MKKYSQFILISVLLILSLFISPTAKAETMKPMTLDVSNIHTYDDMESSQSHEAVIFEDNILVIADGYAGLRFVNISDPTSPYVMNRIQTDLSIRTIDIYGDIIITSSDFSVVGYNISNIANPVKLFEINYSPNSIILVENYLYAGTGQDLKIYKLSNSFTNPVLQKSIPLVDHATDMISINDSLFISESESSISSFDISDPSNPNLLNRLDINFTAYDLQVYEDILMVLDGYNFGISLVNVSDPTNLVYQGNYLLNDMPSGTDLHNSTLYVSTYFSGIHSLNVSDPGDPFLSEQYDPSTSNYVEQLYQSDDVVVGNGFGVVSMGVNGIHIFNTSDPMTFLSAIDPDSADFRSIKQSNNLVFAVSKYDGVIIYDKTSSGVLEQLSMIGSNELNKRVIYKIEVVDNYLYIAAERDLLIYQYWQNGTTQDLNSISTFYPKLLKVIDHDRLILGGYDRIESYDITNRFDLQLQWSWEPSDFSTIMDIFKVDDMIAVVQSSGNVRLFDYSTAGGPTLVKDIDVDENLNSGAYYNGILYLGTNDFANNNFIIYDINDVSNPQLLNFDHLHNFQAVRNMETIQENLVIYSYDKLFTINLTASPYLTTANVNRDIWGINSMSVYEDSFYATKGYQGFISASLNYSPATENYNMSSVSSQEDNNESNISEHTGFSLLNSPLSYLQVLSIAVLVIISRKKYLR